MKPFFISIPHSGEKVPQEATWLQGLEEPILMCDVDRFVDVLYRPVIEKMDLVHVMAEWHRYAADLNRLPSDVDEDSVIGSENLSGSFTTGLHWVKTTRGHVLMKEPISYDLHKIMVEKYFEPFHEQVRSKFLYFKEKQGVEKVYHLDAHSMPSLGTSAHRDPGETRAEVVVSDVDGKSCEKRFLDIVVAAYEQAGFQVKCNWPYKGGRVTQTYGQPDKGQHSIQVEMNRAIYMDEETKQLDLVKADKVQQQVIQAVGEIYENL